MMPEAVIVFFVLLFCFGVWLIAHADEFDDWD